MKKLRSAIVVVALSLTSLTSPAAFAAEGGSSNSSSSADSVTRDKDNAWAIPDKNYREPEQPTFGGVYTGSAPVSLLLVAAGSAAVLAIVAQYPPVAKELKKINLPLPAMRPQLSSNLAK